MKSNSKKQISKMITKRLSLFMVSTVLFFASVQALSAIPFHNAFEEYELINQETKELNLSLLANIQIMIEQNRFNMGHYIPIANIPTYDDGSAISRQIFKQTLRTLAEDDSTANAPIVQTANMLNSAIGTEIQSKNSLVRLRLRALETQAEVVYRGRVNAALTYDIGHQEVNFEVSKNIGQQTYAYTLTDNTDGVVNKVGVRWSF